MLKITIQPFIREEMNMKLAIVDDNPEELQKLYKTIMDYSRTHDVAIACDCFATSAAFLSACAQISYSFVISYKFISALF